MSHERQTPLKDIVSFVVQLTNMKRIGILLLGMIAVCTLNAQQDLRSKQFNLEKGLAIEGYDPVAYFTLHKAVKGEKANAFTNQGVTYYFSTAANRELFKKEPAKYEPAYGGWCAYAMGAKGEKVEVDPETFTIMDGRLFLFYNKFFNNTLKDWNKDAQHLRTQADANWNKLYHP